MAILQETNVDLEHPPLMDHFQMGNPWISIAISTRFLGCSPIFLRYFLVHHWWIYHWYWCISSDISLVNIPINIFLIYSPMSHYLPHSRARRSAAAAPNVTSMRWLLHLEWQCLARRSLPKDNMILLMEEILHQLIGGKHPIIYRVSTIQGGAGFRNHPQYDRTVIYYHYFRIGFWLMCIF